MNGRSKDVKNIDLNIFATTFNVESSDVPDNPLQDIVQLQSKCKVRYNDLPLRGFYKRYRSNDEFPTLRICALKYASVLRKRYSCRPLFSKLTISKSRLCVKLIHASLKQQLKVTSRFSAKVTHLNRGGVPPITLG